MGLDLMNAASARNYAVEMGKIRVAWSTFRGKYDCYPGDCENATTFFSVAVSNGNGNGRVEWVANEAAQAWWEMSLAKLYVNKNVYNGTYYATSPGEKHYLYIYYGDLYSTTPPGNYINTAFTCGNGSVGCVTHTTADASLIDNKMDDGNPSSGAVLAVNASDLTPSHSTMTCYTGSAYNTSLTQPACRLLFRLP